MGVATAIIALGIAVTAAFGPEKRGRKFELAAAAGSSAFVKPKDLEQAGAVPKADRTRKESTWSDTIKEEPH
jgi:hypothetical protein